MLMSVERLNALLALQRLKRFAAVVSARVVENPPGAHWRPGERRFILLTVYTGALDWPNALPTHAVLRALPPELARLDVLLEPADLSRSCACRASVN